MLQPLCRSLAHPCPALVPQPCCSHRVEIVTLAAGVNHSTLEPQAGGWDAIQLGKGDYKEKDEGVRYVHHWRIQGTVPPAASEWVVVERWGQVL